MAKKQSIREWVTEQATNAECEITVLGPEHDNALIGTVLSSEGDLVAVYDRNILIADLGEEWVEFNIEGSLPIALLERPPS